jgi:hypothetical protein
MGTEPTFEWSASSSNAAQNPAWGTASASWTHDWGTITTGSSESGTLSIRLTGAGETATSASFYVCDDGASTWADPVPSDGWITAGTASMTEQTMSSAASLNLTNSITNATEQVQMNMLVPGGASGGTQPFDYRVKYTWA